MHPRLFFTAVSGAAVFALCTVASSRALQWVVDRVILPRFEAGHVAASAVVAGCTAIVVVGLVRAVGVVVRRSFAGAVKYRVGQDLTVDVVRRYVSQPLRWHQQRASGDLVARAGVDVDTATEILSPLPYASGTVLMVLVSSVWLISSDLQLGLLAVTLFPLLAGLNIVYQHKVGRHYDDAQRHLGELSAAVHESFSGVLVVKAFGAEGREAARLAEIAVGLREARVRAVSLRSTFEALLDGLPSLGNIAVLVLGTYRVRAGALSVGQLTSFLYLFTLMVFPLRLIGWALSQLPNSLAGWGRVREVLDEAVGADPAARLGEPPAGLGIEFRDLSFAYEPCRPVVDAMSASVRSGATVAVVGATGSGKTTLLHLVAGLLAPDTGTVAVDGRDPAVVFQEPFLVSGSIAENVTLGAAYTAAEVSTALHLAAAGEFVDALVAGAGTIVGERGVSLSGGQRQRVALARALVRRPAVLLLDDTTSALDPSTEATILANLRASRTGCTTLIVASRPSTIALADEVLFVAEGRIVAQGPHTDLLDAEPAYRALVEAYETDRDADVEVPA